MIGGNKAGDHIEHRGLAGSVRTQEPYSFAATHRQADVMHHRALAIAFRETLGGENVRSAFADMGIQIRIDESRARGGTLSEKGKTAG
ncbi:hypothetical protein GCM10007276_07260 [Agaricicola taiwanensis]|uniref:Uncharacterized protein n=1 Tax=Agaricicola taiwanensis TaxID=591372 RepID=A0A8J2YBC8_9RHOB|nr:hypothetical protein GCM10007276_07260 [Agaricicola taiwanensis]